MPRIKVVYNDGSPAANKKVEVSVDGGGMSSAFTNSDGYANVTASGTNGKIYVNGTEVQSSGRLEGATVRVP